MPSTTATERIALILADTRNGLLGALQELEKQGASLATLQYVAGALNQVHMASVDAHQVAAREEAGN